MDIVEYTVRVRKFKPTDPRLGRYVQHDSRSLLYQVRAAPLDTLKSIRHPSYIPTLDQLNLGSCTGNGSTKAIGTGIFWETVGPLGILSTTDALADEQFAVKVYSRATALDPFTGTFPPTDTGSNGLSAAKALVEFGAISGYLHATSLEATLTALAKQPVIVGTTWRQDMFNPDSSGRVHITGAVAGGHEYCLDEIDVENKRVWIHNSWGTDWGINGRAWLTWDDLATLLADDGDCTVFVPLSAPAPTPTPAPVPVHDSADVEFAKAAHNWLNGFPFFYKKFQGHLNKWLQAKDL